jgi:glycosyltransferase involved in cell wall biosynthesis
VRILMVSQFFAPVIGGEERMVEAMSTELSRRGHEVAVATLQTGSLPAHEPHGKVRVHRIASAAQRLGVLYSDPARPHAPPLPDPLLMRNLIAVIRRERPEVIHGHNWLAQSLMPIKRLTRSPLVLSLHDYSLICATRRFVYAGQPCSGPGPIKCVKCATEHYGRIKGPPVALGTRAMRPLALATVDMFLPVSEAVAHHTGLREMGAVWQVLPDFLPEETLRSEAGDPPDGLPENGFTLFVGDLTRDKGVELLLDAYAELPDAPPLVLIGRAPSPRLSSPPPNVVVLGPRPHAEVMAAWRRCDLGVVPSITEEAFGLAALEAMAAGRPVVAADHGGLREIVVDGETGLLVAPGDVAALRGALRRLHSDPELRGRMGRAGLERMKRFTPAVVVPQLEDVYRRLTATRMVDEGPRPATQTAEREGGS